MVKILFFTAMSGFANRMLPIISFYTWCKQYNIPLAVIWKPKTHRNCMPTDENGIYYTLGDYFKEYPSLVTVFPTIEEALKYHNVDPTQVIHHSIWWQKVVNLKMLDYDYPHFYDCCFLVSLFPQYLSVVGNRCELSLEIQENYANHPYIKMITQSCSEFKFHDKIIKEANQFNNTIGIQLRNTDGGFTVNDCDKVVENLSEIIVRHPDAFFTCDNIKNHLQVMEKGITVYDNRDKFQNNDVGMYYCLVDFNVLAKCNLLYLSGHSSFSLLAYLFNNNPDKKIIYYCY